MTDGSTTPAFTDAASRTISSQLSRMAAMLNGRPISFASASGRAVPGNRPSRRSARSRRRGTNRKPSRCASANTWSDAPPVSA
ncbi:hypothetical protein WR25_06510 [Diploscapter pachys]|uniref:Uncharacterized protein n=1 Tax=Diploscapter pachys TaxID=2018661 RepID=A0A2A2JX78_9BILA|nr:hypothetical protein WR25_06510 [Diploscapter pachys]